MADREAAAEVKRLIAERVAALRTVGYDPQTLKALIAREHVRGEEVMAQLKEEHRAEELARSKQASRAIYGADDLIEGSDPVAHRASYRDAQDRAERVESAGQAKRLLQQAERSGDELLARAVAVKAQDRRWKDVTDAYSETRPQWRAALENIGDTRLSVGMGANLVFGLKRPEELERMSRSQIETLVRDREDLYKAIDSPPKAPTRLADAFDEGPMFQAGV